MCRYACNCRHETCAQAVDGCFIVGWPCLAHNKSHESEFSNNDVVSRNNDWARTTGMMRELVKGDGKIGGRDSTALPVFIQTKFDRLAKGTKFNVPKAMDRWLIDQGVLSRPTEKFKDRDFEEYCQELGQYFEMYGFPILGPTKETAEQDGGEKAERKDAVVSFDTFVERTIMLTFKANLETDGGNVDVSKMAKPLAWKPTQNPEISLLLKTPPFSPVLNTAPISPTSSVESFSEATSKLQPNPFRYRERHSFYALENESQDNLEDMTYISIDLAKFDLNQVEEGPEPLSQVEEEDESDDQDLTSHSAFQRASQLTARSGIARKPSYLALSRCSSRSSDSLHSRSTLGGSVSSGTSTGSQRSTLSTSKARHAPLKAKQAPVPKPGAEKDVFDGDAHDIFLELADEL